MEQTKILTSTELEGGLDLRPRDVLLDLCCGNGAIIDPIFARCRGAEHEKQCHAQPPVSRVAFA